MGNGVNSLHVWCNSESGNVSINVDIGLSFSLRSGYGRMSMFDESLIKIKYQFLIKDRLISTFHMFVLFTVFCIYIIYPTMFQYETNVYETETLLLHFCIKYIMYIMFKGIASFMTTVISRVGVRVGVLLTGGRSLHGRIFSQKGKVCSKKLV